MESSSQRVGSDGLKDSRSWLSREASRGGESHQQADQKIWGQYAVIGNPDKDLKASARYSRQAAALRKPLFIALKAEYFEAFKAGTKDTEYRRHGQRWNEDTCRIGRRSNPLP